MRPLRGKMDWERMFRISDYHRISNLIYPGVLGNDNVPQNWRERFFERYQESLQFGESCDEGERELLALLDLKEIPVLVLESSKRRNLYEMKELAGECALRLYLMREDYSLTKGFLIDLGFETDRIYHLGGERMRRDDGFAVEIYDHIPYKTPAYKKQMRQLFEKAHLLEGYTFVSGLDDKTRLAYLLARASYLYVTRELLVRQLLDLYLLHKKLKEEDLEREWLWLKKLKIGQLSEKLLSLSYVWFGTKAERADLAITVSEDLELYDEMENRILGYGKEYEVTIPEALALAGSILKEEEKENRKARRKLFLQKTRELRKQLWELLREYLPRKEKK
ncbi:MAG: nucleotidyltransferase family protein [Clostridium sp.]|nr:nucleotidyltransferase family protein [Clostridium sp.]